MKHKAIIHQLALKIKLNSTNNEEEHNKEFARNFTFLKSINRQSPNKVSGLEKHPKINRLGWDVH